MKILISQFNGTKNYLPFRKLTNRKGIADIKRKQHNNEIYIKFIKAIMTGHINKYNPWWINRDYSQLNGICTYANGKFIDYLDKHMSPMCFLMYAPKGYNKGKSKYKYMIWISKFEIFNKKFYWLRYVFQHPLKYIKWLKICSQKSECSGNMNNEK